MSQPRRDGQPRESLVKDVTAKMATLTTKMDNLPQHAQAQIIGQASLAIPGTQLLPPPFCGTLHESAQDFVDRLNQFCRLQNYTDDRKLQLVGCLLHQRGHEWFSELTDAAKTSWETFQDALLEKFGPSSRDDFHIANLMQQRQQPNKTVDAYTKNMRHRLKMAGPRRGTQNAAERTSMACNSIQRPWMRQSGMHLMPNTNRIPRRKTRYGRTCSCSNSSQVQRLLQPRRQ